MQLHNQNILFFTRTMALGGTENIVLQLCEVFKPLVKSIVVCSSGGINETVLNEMGISHYTIPDIEIKTVQNINRVCKIIKNVIKEKRITVVHTHHRMAAFYCQLIGLPKNIVYINTSHTAFYDKKVLTHFAFRNFYKIACGEGVKYSLIKGLGFKDEQITVICNSVKTDEPKEPKMIPSIKKAKEKGAVVFTAIGRLSKEKGVDCLINALPLMKTKNYFCVIVGSGPEEDVIKKEAVKLGVTEKIIFLGYRKDVLNILSQVDFLVQPSLQEGLPLTPIEAFSKARPVIGTDIDGTREIVKDGINGFLVTPGDSGALANAIDRMCRIKRDDFEKMAINTYQEKYSYTVFAQNYIDFYKNI